MRSATQLPLIVVSGQCDRDRVSSLENGADECLEVLLQRGTGLRVRAPMPVEC
ncbi:MAG: hypothetical protein IPK52_20560 [Chloroflexi bacterium]|nr:hypothetical protein [Chloroflexota bacterium]